MFGINLVIKKTQTKILSTTPYLLPEETSWMVMITGRPQSTQAKNAAFSA